jgi:hypothetical protein
VGASLVPEFCSMDMSGATSSLTHRPLCVSIGFCEPCLFSQAGGELLGHDQTSALTTSPLNTFLMTLSRSCFHHQTIQSVEIWGPLVPC